MAYITEEYSLCTVNFCQRVRAFAIFLGRAREKQGADDAAKAKKELRESTESAENAQKQQGDAGQRR